MVRYLPVLGFVVRGLRVRGFFRIMFSVDGEISSGVVRLFFDPVVVVRVNGSWVDVLDGF